MRPLVDRFGRVHDYLRVSVTDKCDLRCTYCMPEEGVAWLANEKLLSFAEIERVVRIFVNKGVTKVRLTCKKSSIDRWNKNPCAHHKCDASFRIHSRALVSRTR
jgi:2-iminoacetate synthase ThiH